MSFNIPNTFVAGTKARADEVNENFTSVQNEINKSNQNLAQVKEDLDYIKNEMLDDFIVEAKMLYKTGKSKFCVNYANLASDNKTPDIFKADCTTLGFKVGGEFPSLTITNAYGDSKTFENLDDIDIQGYTDGFYNIFLTLEGNIELFNARIFRMPNEPKGVLINDIWLKTFEPWACYKFTGISWTEYEGVPIGNIAIAEGKITKVLNFELNTQYLDSDCRFLTQRSRENISKRFESDWFDAVPKGSYDFEHNLNLDPLRCRARVIARVKEDFGNYSAGDIVETLYSNYSGNEANNEIGYILKFNANSISLGIGNSLYHCCNNFGANGYSFLLRSNVEYKIIVTQDVN